MKVTKEDVKTVKEFLNLVTTKATWPGKEHIGPTTVEVGAIYGHIFKMGKFLEELEQAEKDQVEEEELEAEEEEDRKKKGKK